MGRHEAVPQKHAILGSRKRMQNSLISTSWELPRQGTLIEWGKGRHAKNVVVLKRTVKGEKGEA